MLSKVSEGAPRNHHSRVLTGFSSTLLLFTFFILFPPNVSIAQTPPLDICGSDYSAPDTSWNKIHSGCFDFSVCQDSTGPDSVCIMLDWHPDDCGGSPPCRCFVTLQGQNSKKEWRFPCAAQIFDECRIMLHKNDSPYTLCADDISPGSYLLVRCNPHCLGEVCP